MYNSTTLVLFSFMILTSCSEADNRNKIDNKKSEHFDTISDQKMSSKENIDTTEIKYDFQQLTFGADSSIYFGKNGDSLFFYADNKLLSTSSIQPESVLEIDSSRTQRVYDDAFILANNLIIVRGITTLGDFCHIPDVEQVEIHSTHNDSIIILNDSLKSTSLLGFDITHNFLGGRFNSPDGSWGVITIEAEGELYGFMIIREDGSYLEVDVSRDYYFTGETYKASFNDSLELVWNQLNNDTVPVKVVLNKEGTIQVNQR